MDSSLKKLWSRWLNSRFVKFGRKVAAFMIGIVFTVAYYTVIVPFGLIFRIFARMPRSGWHDIDDKPVSLEDARRQY